MKDYERHYNLISRDWSQISGTIDQEIVHEIKTKQISHLKKHRTGLNASALTVVDITRNQFLFVDDDITKVTGCSKEEYFRKGMRFIFSKSSFAHLPALVSSIIHQRRFFSRLQPFQYNDYVVNRELAYTTQSKKRNWVLHQVLHYFIDNDRKIVALASLQTNINHLKEDEKFKYYIYDRINNEIVYPKKLESQKEAPPELSEREHAILQMMLNGQTSREIANDLSISFHTVRTHRKNIMKKTNSRNIVDLYKYCSSL